MKKPRVWIVGCGRISIRHIASVKTVEEAELFSCCDIRPERAE